MKTKKLFVIAFILIILLLSGSICYAFFKSSKAYDHFRQFTRQKTGINVTMINDYWGTGVDAIGVVKVYASPGVAYLDYYYRDTNSFTWHHFYRKRIYM